MPLFEVRLLSATGLLGEVSPSLLIICERRRYLINCGEGVQRLCVQHAIRLATRLSRVYLTRLHWRSSVGGLPGMLLTLSDASPTQAMQVMVAGPRGTAHMLAGCRSFLYRPQLRVHVTESDTKENVSFTDFGDDDAGEGLSCRALELRPHVMETNEDEKVLRLNAEHAILNRILGSGIPSLPRPIAFAQCCENEKEKQSPIDALPNLPESERNVHLCLIFKVPDMRGKFLVDKARALGVKPGAHFSQLSRGESVTLENGNIVTPEQCLEPTRVGPLLLVVDCPDEGFISSLTKQHENVFSEIQKQQSQVPIAFIFHMAPPAVFHHDEYSQWMKSFGAETRHILIHDAFTFQEHLFTDSARVHYQLRAIDPSLFPSLSRPLSATEQQQFTLNQLSNLNISFGQTGAVFRLMPTVDVDERGCFNVSQQQEENWRSEAESQILMNSALQPEQDDQKEHIWLNEKEIDSVIEELKTFDNVIITTLGTGSALPAKYRNVSATHISVEGRGSFLLDCGEGTLTQMRRCLMRGNLREMIENMRMVCISHLHADHHLGLVGLLTARRDLNIEEPLLIIGPVKLQQWLLEYGECEALSPFHFVSCQSLERGDWQDAIAEKILRDTLGLISVQAVPVLHCPASYGFVIQQEKGWRMVYSGDTRPCPDLIQAGQGATVLIHEATFANELIAEAMSKMHSTAGEAYHVAQKMQAKLLILNHFSQRYAKQGASVLEDVTPLKGGFTLPPALLSCDMMSLRLTNWRTWYSRQRTVVPLLLEKDS